MCKRLATDAHIKRSPGPWEIVSRVSPPAFSAALYRRRRSAVSAAEWRRVAGWPAWSHFASWPRYPLPRRRTPRTSFTGERARARAEAASLLSNFASRAAIEDLPAISLARPSFTIVPPSFSPPPTHRGDLDANGFTSYVNPWVSRVARPCLCSHGRDCPLHMVLLPFRTSLPEYPS